MKIYYNKIILIKHINYINVIGFEDTRESQEKKYSEQFFILLLLTFSKMLFTKPRLYGFI